MAWELSIPDPSCPGTFQGGDIYDTEDEALAVAQSIWGADNKGRIYIVNELPDDEFDDETDDE